METETKDRAMPTHREALLKLDDGTTAGDGTFALTDREDHCTVGLPFVDNPRITCRNVNVYYGDKHAIRDVSIDVAGNEVLAMIGPSGSTGNKSVGRSAATALHSEGHCRAPGGDSYG